jgi:hypothetical protein
MYVQKGGNKGKKGCVKKSKYRCVVVGGKLFLMGGNMVNLSNLKYIIFFFRVDHPAGAEAAPGGGEGH